MPERAEAKQITGVVLANLADEVRIMGLCASMCLLLTPAKAPLERLKRRGKTFSVVESFAVYPWTRRYDQTMGARGRRVDRQADCPSSFQAARQKTQLPR